MRTSTANVPPGVCNWSLESKTVRLGAYLRTTTGPEVQVRTCDGSGRSWDETRVNPPRSIGVMLLFCIACATPNRTTWEDDAREGVKTASRTAVRAAAPIPKQTVTLDPPEAPIEEDFEALARELELAILRFTSKRRALMNEDSNKKARIGWPAPMVAAWKSVLSKIEKGMKKPAGVLPRRVLIQTRVSLDVERDLTERRYGPAPKDIVIKVQVVFTRVALHMRASRPPPPRTSGRHRLRLGWPLSPIIVTSPFGYRRDPILGYQQLRFHSGVDLGGRQGDIVSAAAAGRVVTAGWLGGHGRTVVVQHPGGYVTMYAHLHRILVRHGMSIEPGTPIGLLGSSGRSTGPHLHFEVRRGGLPIDPLEVIDAQLALVGGP